MMKILVTGASGFVGRYLVNDLSKTDEVIACVRKKSNLLPSSVQQIVGNNFFDIALPKDTDVIVHLAGIAHNKNNSVDEFKKINVDGTLELARKALEANIKRFIFISSIGVNGNSTHGKAFTEQDTPNPTNDYTKSKYEAEKALAKLFENITITQDMIDDLQNSDEEEKGYAYEHIKGIIENIYFCLENQLDMVSFCH